MGKCSFNTIWLSKEDGTGRKVSEWAQKHTEESVFCNLCESSVIFSKKGFQALTQHAGTTKHMEQCELKLDPEQLRLSKTPTSEIASESIQLISIKDSATKAELIWTMKCIVSNYSALSCSGIADIFKSMFPDGFPKDFSISPKKFSYITTDALYPYFRDKVKKDLHGALYTLMYDETTNAAGAKELQTGIRYWSNMQGKVVYEHLQTFFLGSAKADVIIKKLKEALDNVNLPLKDLTMLGTDGPNVNKKVHRLMKEELKLLGKNLIDIGTCNIHIVHNSYLKGIMELGEDASELVIAVHRFFDGWPSRWEEFSEIQIRENVPNKRFLKHTTSRWLTLEAAAKRLLELWPAVIEYFLKFLPKKTTDVTSGRGYKNILNLLRKPTIKAELHFIISSAGIFTKFTGMFQKEEPLIHILYEELLELLQTLIGRFCKKSTEVKNESNLDNLLTPVNYLPIKDIYCNSEISDELKKVTEMDKVMFFKGMQKHYISACSHLIEKTSLCFTLLKHLQCFHPKQRKKKHSCQDIIEASKILAADIDSEDRLLDEWKLYQLESDLSDVESTLDAYWGYVFQIKNSTGELKYKNIAKVGKKALILSHGNADLERGFSSSNRVLTEERSAMKERTLNAILTVKSALKVYNNKPESVPITKELLTYARGAYRNYQNFLDEQNKQLKEEEELKKKEEADRASEQENRKKVSKERKSIKEYEATLKEKREKEESKRKTADALFLEATERLKKGVEKRNMEEIQLAQAMLTTVTAVREEESSERKEADKIQKTLEKRKSSLIQNYFSKKPKTD